MHLKSMHGKSRFVSLSLFALLLLVLSACQNVAPSSVAESNPQLACGKWQLRPAVRERLCLRKSLRCGQTNLVPQATHRARLTNTTTASTKLPWVAATTILRLITPLRAWVWVPTALACPTSTFLAAWFIRRPIIVAATAT